MKAKIGLLPTGQHLPDSDQAGQKLT
jgi:hypothetical protein